MTTLKYSAEISAEDRRAVLIQNDGGLTVLAILGPKGGVQAKVWLNERSAAQVATALMKSYREGRS
jgi:hypothetical protein